MTISNYEVKELTIELGEKITNGTFDTDTDWTKGAGWTISGGIASHTGADSFLYQDVSLVAGKRYKVLFDLNITSGLTKVYIGNTFSAVTYASSGSYTLEGVASGDANLFFEGILTNVSSIDNVSITEIPPLNGFKTGTKYLENQTADTAARQSDVAYGTWEFPLYVANNITGASRILFINNLNDIYPNVNAYGIDWRINKGFRFFKLADTPSFITLFDVADGYLDTNTWYDIKIARLQSSGVFKDIPTLQTSDLINADYTTFSNASRYGFSATSDGTATHTAGTPLELSFINGVSYLVEFDWILNSGTAPAITFRSSFNGISLSNTLEPINGRNSHILTATSTNNGILRFRNTGTATNYTISGLTIRRIYDPSTFAVFIKGGSFGEDTWTLVDTTSGSGTNPCTDDTHKSSKYFVIDLDQNDAIGPIKITNGNLM